MSSLFDPKTRRYTAPAFGTLASLGTLAGGYDAAIKRKAYFAFHFDDIMRVNDVRKAWNRTFCDSSLWESKRLTDPEAIKQLIRKGEEYTSAVCVLAGAETWLRQWVKYEIARAVIDERGLLAVHINGIKHVQTSTPHPRGPNPLGPVDIKGIPAESRM